MVDGLVACPELLDKLDGVIESTDPLADGVEGEVVSGMLHFEPPGPYAEDETSAADDVDGGGGLGEENGVAIGVADDHRADRNVLSHAGQGPEQRPGLEAGAFVAAGVRGDEVIVAPERIEAKLLD